MAKSKKPHRRPGPGKPQGATYAQVLAHKAAVRKGLEQAARDAGYDVVVSKLPMQYSGRYVAEVERGTGFCKLIFDKATTRLLGAHLIGNYASEIIHGAAILVEGEYRVHDIRQLVYPHPTVSEIIREAAFACPL